MNPEKVFEDLLGLLQAARNDAVISSRKCEALIEEIDKRIELVKKLRQDSRIIMAKGGQTK